MAGLMQRWGLGVDLRFNPGDTSTKLQRTQTRVRSLRDDFQRVGDSASRFASSLAGLGMALAPIGALFGATIGHGSRLAADLEAQSLTMRVMMGDAEKAAGLMEQIRQRAAATPFAEGDLIEGSKRLLRLTQDNADANLDMLDTMMTMTALNPTKTITDSVEALLDAASGGGFERLKEYGISFRAEDFAEAGRPGGEAWAAAVYEALQAEMARLTRGEDLVGALSKTFSGRASTLGDAFTNIFRGIGVEVNQVLGPLLDPITEWINGELAPAVTGAAGLLAGWFVRALAAAQPMIDGLLGLWDAMGSDGQIALMAAVGAFGAFAAIVTPIGAVLGGLVFLVTSFVSSLAAVWPLITAVGGALLSALSAPVLIPIAFGIAAVVAALMGLWAAFSEPGDGPMAVLGRIGSAIQVGLVAAFEMARTAWDGFASGFRAAWSGMAGPIDRIREAIRPLSAMILEFLALGSGSEASAFKGFFWLVGALVGQIATTLVDGIAFGFVVISGLLSTMGAALRPWVLSMRQLLGALTGIVDGSLSARDAFTLMIKGIAGALVSIVNSVLQVIMGAVEIVLRLVAETVRRIPGMAGVIDATGGLGSDAIASARLGLERSVSNAIAGVDLAANRSAQAKANAPAPDVRVSPILEPEIHTSTTVEIDGNEIARATGAQTVKAGQRQGEPVPAQARGRVLRGGVVGTLGQAEAW